MFQRTKVGFWRRAVIGGSGRRAVWVTTVSVCLVGVAQLSLGRPMSVILVPH